MSGPARRVVFNPTSIPELRPARSYMQTARKIPGRPLLKTPASWPWRSIRQESTELGWNLTGHIDRRANEGIVFFDSE